MSTGPEHDVAAAHAAWSALQSAGGVIDIPGLMSRWGTNRRRIYDYIGDTTFPEPVLSPAAGGHYWLLADVDRWMHQHAERQGRRGPKPRHLADH